MATELVNTFTSFHLSNQEQLSGQVLSTYQRMMIQNYVSETAHQKLALVLDPKDMDKYRMDLAYMAGKLDILQYILTVSEEAIQAVEVQKQSQSE